MSAYVGNLGRQLPYNQELNAAAPGTGTAGLPLRAAFGRDRQYEPARDRE